MILFNLLFFKNTSACSKKFITYPSSIENKSDKSYKFSSRKLHLAYILKQPSILSENKLDVASYHYRNKHIGQKLLNVFWGQDIFLSVNHKSLSQYNLSLNSLNKQKNEQKSLVSQFSKSLFNGSIQVSLTHSFNSSFGYFSSMQYLWAKKLKSQISNLHRIFHENLYKKDLSNINTALNGIINSNYLPLFIVSNHLGQMVISEPPTDLNGLKYTETYSIIKKHHHHLYHSFFFTNYKDAQEYMYYIQKYYKLDDKKLRIFTCEFGTFYQTMNKFYGNICFKLIPDLKEVSELLKQYRHYRKVSFHKKQNYNSNSFQGQPLYLLKKNPSDFYYNLLKKQDKKYDLAFLNYKEAIQIYNKSQNRAANTKLKKPNLLVYNLECLIKDQITLGHDTKNSYFIIPSKDSYLFTKKNKFKSHQYLLPDSCLETMAYITLWSKRIFWSLTSMKP